MGAAHQRFSNPSVPGSLLPAMNRFGDLDDLRELQATERWYIIHVCKRSSKSGKMEDSLFLQYLLGKNDEVTFLCLLDAVVEVHLGSPKSIPITKLNNTKKWGYNFYLLSYKQMVSYEVAKQISSQRKDIFNPMMDLPINLPNSWVILVGSFFAGMGYQRLVYSAGHRWRPGPATSTKCPRRATKTGS